MRKRTFIAGDTLHDSRISLPVRAGLLCGALTLIVGLLAARAAQLLITEVLHTTYRTAAVGASRHLSRVLQGDSANPVDAEQFTNAVRMVAEDHPNIRRWTLALGTGKELVWPPSAKRAATPVPKATDVRVASVLARMQGLLAPVLPEAITCHQNTSFGRLRLLVRAPDLGRYSLYWSGALVACVLLATGVGYVSADGHARVSRALQGAFKRLGQGDLAFRLSPRGGPESRRMVRQFNVMVSRLEKTRQLQEQRSRQLELLNQTKSEFLSIVSHDLRTPLTSVKFYTELMLDGKDTLPDAHRTEFLQIMNTEADRLSRLIDDLLDLQQLDTGKMKWSMQEADLSETIRATIKSFDGAAAQRDVTLTLECPDQLPLAVVDPDRIAQVLGNLVSNAIKFSPPGRNVAICVRTSPRELQLDVRDQGPGIPREHWSTIFEKFMQLEDVNVRESNGTGLGLYIVKKIVDAHNGCVWVESEPGQGACFSVTLPAGKALAAQMDEARHADAQPKALVCDPEPFLAASVAQALQFAGFEVTQAHSGQQLLSHAQRTQPALIITEIMLPDLDGLEMIRVLKGAPETEAIPIVVHSYTSDPAQAITEGATAHLAKPASRDQIVQYARAYQRREGAGKQRLTFVIGHADSTVRQRIARDVVSLGHIAIEAESFDDLAHRAATVNSDLVICAEALTDGAAWPALQKLKQHPETSELPVVVLVREIRRQHAKLAAGFKSVYVCREQFSPDDLAAILTDIEETREADNRDVPIQDFDDA